MVLSSGVRPGTILSVSVNARFTARYGSCKRVYEDGRTKGFAIEIAAFVLEDAIPKNAVLETIIHEILHSVPGCFNHGEKWKEMAARVMAWYPSLVIARTTKREHFGLQEENELTKTMPERYLLRCTSCGKEFPRKTKSKIIRAPWRYRCPCGGKLQRIH